MEKHMDLKTSTCPISNNTVTAVTGEVRTLVVGWLVQWQKGPLILTVKEAHAREAYEKALSQDKTASIQKMTVHVERFKELGRNLFNPLPPHVKNVVDWRNKIVREWHDTVGNIKGANPVIVWDRVAKRNGIQCLSAHDFNQWVMDHMKYIMRTI
jgi:hypothetical protein